MRLMSQGLYGQDESMKDGHYIRVDQIERDASIQAKVEAAYAQMNQNTLNQLADVEGFKHAFLNQFGFDLDEIDYSDRPDPLLLPALADFTTRERRIA